VTVLVGWPPARWSGPAGARTNRADRVHELVQRLADLVAGLEGEPVRPVPRLDNDLALPDQIRVLVADLLLATPGEDDPLTRAAGWLDATRRDLAS
jgi:hypothetical protein